MAAVRVAGSAVPQEVAYLWPCNVTAWHCWCELQTQWRTGMGGPTGLDYAGVRAYLDEMGHTGPDRVDIFAGIRAAESATLEVWADQRRAEDLLRQQQQKP